MVGAIMSGPQKGVPLLRIQASVFVLQELPPGLRVKGCILFYAGGFLNWGPFRCTSDKGAVLYLGVNKGPLI